MQISLAYDKLLVAYDNLIKEDSTKKRNLISVNDLQTYVNERSEVVAADQKHEELNKAEEETRSECKDPLYLLIRERVQDLLVAARPKTRGIKQS